jgi:hypothetical protein
MVDVLMPNSACDHFTEAPFSDLISIFVFLITSTECFFVALLLATELPTGLSDASLVERMGLVIAANLPL